MENVCGISGGETGVDANWRGLEAQVWMQVSGVEGVRSQRWKRLQESKTAVNRGTTQA